jgi:hypothetical protein
LQPRPFWAITHDSEFGLVPPAFALQAIQEHAERSNGKIKTFERDKPSSRE